MTDKELLEMAAKAAGIELEFRVLVWSEGSTPPCYVDKYSVSTCTNFGPVIRWNPLTDDGDALRLMVKLGLDINSYTKSNETSACLYSKGILHRCINRINDDPYAATRRAIVRAAAEIGKTL